MEQEESGSIIVPRAYLVTKPHPRSQRQTGVATRHGDNTYVQEVPSADVTWTTVRPSLDVNSIFGDAPTVASMSDGEPSDDDDDDGSTDQCQCVGVILSLFRTAEYSLCVEYGASFLESLDPGTIGIRDALLVLKTLSIAFTRLSEIERAKATLALWSELIDNGKHCLSFAERHQWRLRHYIATGDLNCANGEREEAIEAYVLAWRVQAYLCGPESLKCLQTYVRVAEIKVQLVHDKDATTMLAYATQQMGTVPTDGRHFHLWSSIRRLRCVLEMRQRNWPRALAVLEETASELQRCLQQAERNARTADPAVQRMDGKHTTAIKLELGRCLMRTAEVSLHCAPDNAPYTTVLDAFEEGLEHVRECLPPTNDDVVRGRLRLAALCASVRRVSHLANAKWTLKLFEMCQLRRGGGDSTNNNPSPALSSSGPSSSTTTHLGGGGSYYHQQTLSMHHHTWTHEEAIAKMTDADIAAAAAACARSMIQEVLDELQQADVRGGRHVHLLIEVFEALGDADHHRGDHKAASTAYNKAKSAALQLFAPDHERCVLLQHKLAEALLAAGHWEDALSLLQELLEWCHLCPDGHMPPVPLVVLHHSMGSAMRVAERFDKAEEYFLAALQDPTIDFETKAKVLGNLAAMHLTRGDVSSALHFNQQALLVRLARLGEWHDDVAASYGNIAVLYQRKGNAKQALFHANKCLEIVMGRPDKASCRRSSSIPGKDRTSPERSAHGAAAHNDGAHNRTSSAAAKRSIVPIAARDAPRTPNYFRHPFFEDVSRVKAWAVRTLKAQQNPMSGASQ